MIDPKKIKISEFSYDLPQEKIAKFPLNQRDMSKLLVYKDKKIYENKFFYIDKFLPSDSLLVVNNTKVIYARLQFRKKTGAKIEIFILNPYEPSDYERAFRQNGKVKWICLVGNLKKWKSGELVKEFEYQGKSYRLTARYVSPQGEGHIIEFDFDRELTFSDVLETLGNIPIPPYLQREATENDKTTYQTVYSKIKGSVAAPTAGLHFTERVFEKLRKKNIQTAEVTLHVGAGTFKPVKSETIGQHNMHTEFFTVSAETISKLIEYQGNITSVGTTSMRTLESLYWVGYKLLTGKEPFNFIEQWEIYEYKENISAQEALKAVKQYLKKHNLNAIFGNTQIIIVPGYEFKVVDRLITNFHQPQSTLLLLVAAFVGDDWKKIYDYALKHDFRFLSYGDSSLLFKSKLH